MKILGILGSPRKKGNSDILLNEALNAARSKGAETEKICLYDLKFSGCIACGGCNKTGECVLSDGMTPLYDKLRTADAVIIAAPIYFAGVPAQLKAMIDRCQSDWVAKYVLKSKTKTKTVKGAFISVCGYKKNIFFEAAKKPIEVFFKTMNIDYSEELFFAGVEGKSDIKNVKGALEKARKLGIEIANG
jgi:multimeric flavodoxin WrbA